MDFLPKRTNCNSPTSGFNKNGYVEKDPKKIITQLTKEMILEKTYDEISNKTHMTISLPSWLSRDYSPETVRLFTNHIIKETK